MTVGALIKADTKELIKLIPNMEYPQRIDLPGVGQVSPAEIGWEGDGFAIIEVVAPVIPEGKVADGQVVYSVVDDKLVGTVQVKDAPIAPDGRNIPAELDALVARVVALEGK
jgi:hypothetical protein